MQSYHQGFGNCVFHGLTNARSEFRGPTTPAVCVIRETRGQFDETFTSVISKCSCYCWASRLGHSKKIVNL